ncbi:SHOCT domain-containing protein [Halorussus sp. AFM4]|uniref:SHOCT domain-containing protein n=1 Tax=Halorussus sp. AFM4 TaxID=3421651 RepID=UPI003EB84913
MNDASDDSTFRALHRLVEHYTPDGALGRSLLGVPALLLAPFMFLGGLAVLGSGGSFAAFVTALVVLVLSVPTLVVGLVSLWPVYLSLIGNVESAGAYPDGAARPAEHGETPEDILKRRYAAGELNREEFERRLDSVLGAGGRADGSRGGERSRSNEPRQRRGREPEPERSRNR